MTSAVTLNLMGFFDEFSSANSLPKVKTKADMGDAQAQLKLGKRYYYGNEVKKDKSEALKWILKSAEKSNPEAMRIVGLMNMRGEGTQSNFAVGLRWLESAYKASDPMAAYFIGLMYEDGQGVDKDLKVAFSWYKKGADRADDWSQYALGNLYQFGYEEDQVDMKKAAKWYLLSAKLGNKFAQYQAGRLYTHGLGVDEDIPRAMRWYRQAASQGVWLARNNLAWLLSTNSNDEIRNGKEAIQLLEGLEDQNLNKDEKATSLDTLAAAYAETGRFEDAVSAQQRALNVVLEMNSDNERVNGFKKRIEIYRNGNAWRE